MPPVLTPGSIADLGGGGGGAVASVDSRIGVVTLADLYDVLGAADAKIAQSITNGVTTSAPSQDQIFDALALKAPAANPTFTGTVTIPDAALAIADTSGLQSALDLKAALASPALTGNPTAPTPTEGDNDTSIATTAFVTTAVAAVGDTVVPTKYAVGDGAGNHTTTSTTFVDINAAYAQSVPAVAGNLLRIELVASVVNSAAGGYTALAANLAGADIALQAVIGIPSETTTYNGKYLYFHVVQSGDISGGNVAVKPRYRSNNGANTATVYNESTLNRKPVFAVTNLGTPP